MTTRHPYCFYPNGLCVHQFRPGEIELHFEDEYFPSTITYAPLRPVPRAEPPLLEEHPALREPSSEQPNRSCWSSIMGSNGPLDASPLPSPPAAKADATIDKIAFPIPEKPSLHDLAKLISDDQAFENTSTSVAASQMRNALNNLADTVEDPTEKKVCIPLSKHSI